MVCLLWNYGIYLFLFLEMFQIDQGQPDNDVMKDIDSVPSNVHSSHQEVLLYVFEDNEAVINMITKGRSPTMRHVSRTHRVAFDCLFDRINLDLKDPNQVHQQKTNMVTS